MIDLSRNIAILIYVIVLYDKKIKTWFSLHPLPSLPLVHINLSTLEDSSVPGCDS